MTPPSTTARIAVFAPLDSGGRVEAVTERLRGAIALGLIGDGEQLPRESELANALGRRAAVGPHTAAPYHFAEQHRPPASARVSEVAQMTFEHVFEVDPRLMQEHVLQQVFPNWDTLRIMRSRHDHLAWMREHFASAAPSRCWRRR
jgi:hypothetical protein